jgi:4-hydroxy-3-methylbut-2-enyl diphosphate reductase IspH
MRWKWRRCGEGARERLQAPLARPVATRSDDLCYAMTNRQAALKEIAGKADAAVVIGVRHTCRTRSP